MWLFIERWVVAPTLLLVATYQLTLAALTRTTIFVCTKACTMSASERISLTDDPLIFYVALTQAVVFLGWAAWIYVRRRP